MYQIYTSPFADRVGTNYCPLDSEIQCIRDLLVEPSLELKRLDNEIRELEAAADRLQAERQRISAYVDAHSALLSPIRHLPLDVVQEIFVACLPADRNAVMSACDAPVLLGRICSQWRKLSLSTPRLWASLHFIIAPHEPKRLEVMKMWLGRSGSCPLSISFYVNAWHDDCLGPFVNELGCVARRWKSMSMVATPSVLKMLAGLKQHDLPMLEEFSLINIREHPESLEFLQGSRIRRISLNGDVPFSRLSFQWERLTYLSLVKYGWVGHNSIPSTLVLEILAQCANLRTCQLQIDEPGATEAVPPVRPNVVLPRLRSLTLGVVPDNVVTASSLFRLIRHLTLPELRQLTILGACAVLNPRDTHNLLTGSTQLWNLCLPDACPSESLKALFLFGLPSSIQQLSLRTVSGFVTSPLDDSDEFLSLLTPDPNNPTRLSCPDFHDIWIDGWNISETALLRFICACMQTAGQPKLKRARINFRCPSDTDILPQLQPFLAEGLEVDLSYASDQTLFTVSSWYGTPEALE